MVRMQSRMVRRGHLMNSRIHALQGNTEILTLSNFLRKIKVFNAMRAAGNSKNAINHILWTIIRHKMMMTSISYNRHGLFNQAMMFEAIRINQ